MVLAPTDAREVVWFADLMRANIRRRTVARLSLLCVQMSISSGCRPWLGNRTTKVKCFPLKMKLNQIVINTNKFSVFRRTCVLFQVATMFALLLSENRNHSHQHTRVEV